MTDESLDAQIESFYKGVTLPEPTAEAILRAGELVRESRRWKLATLAACLGLVVVTVTASGLVWSLASRSAPLAQPLAGEDPTTESATPDDRPERQAPAVVESDRSPRENGTPQPHQVRDTMAPDRYPYLRVVAVNVHGSGCPKCRNVVSTIAEIESEFAGEPVLFATLDLSVPAARNQSRMLSHALGVDTLADESPQTARIIVAASEEDALESLDAPVGRDHLAQHIRGLLARKTRPQLP